MFTDGEIDGVLIAELVRHEDSRGWLVELFRSDELDESLAPRMGYVSQTAPGVVRGPHEHLEQTDLFVFLGPGDFRVTLWDARSDSPTHRRRMILSAGQSRPLQITVPPGVVHAYQNVSAVPGWVINCPNRLYAGAGRRDPVDEIRHELQADNEYLRDLTAGSS